jgi:hypothetical protein
MLPLVLSSHNIIFTCTHCESYTVLFVPDPGSRDRDVVLVKRGACRVSPRGGREFGMGRGRGGDEEGEVSLRATWGQGGQGRITPKEGFQVSKRK